MTNQTITPPATKQEAIQLLRSDVEAWNRMREANPEWIPNLRYAILHGSDLSDADLRYADLRGADLHVADLSDADLRYADLSDADLRGADLSGSNLYGADLSGAKLSRSQLAPYIGEPDWQN